MTTVLFCVCLCVLLLRSPVNAETVTEGNVGIEFVDPSDSTIQQIKKVPKTGDKKPAGYLLMSIGSLLLCAKIKRKEEAK